MFITGNKIDRKLYILFIYFYPSGLRFETVLGWWEI